MNTGRPQRGNGRGHFAGTQQGFQQRVITGQQGQSPQIQRVRLAVIRQRFNLGGDFGHLQFGLLFDLAAFLFDQCCLRIEFAFHLGRFIEQTRSIPADAIIVRQNWLRAYEFTTDRGAAALNDYARANDPFTRVGRQQIAVEVSSVIRASNDSFRVAWTERHYENGQLSRTERWTAILTIVIQTPRDAERLRANPLGIYVNAISWSREMSQ